MNELWKVIRQVTTEWVEDVKTLFNDGKKSSTSDEEVQQLV